MDDALVAMVIAIGVISGLICLLVGIFHLIEKMDEHHISRKRKETVRAVKLFRKVNESVGCDLTVSEYDEAVRYVIRKYHLADKNGALDTRGQNLDYISMLISEAVGQTRLFKATLAIAQADMELEDSSEIELERTAITA